MSYKLTIFYRDSHSKGFVIRETELVRNFRILPVRIIVDAGNWWIRARQIGSTRKWNVSIALFRVFSFGSKSCDVQMKASMKQKVQRKIMKEQESCSTTSK